MPLHIHIDTVGGLSGDMFIASMLDAYPNLIEPINKHLSAAGILKHVSLDQSNELVNGIAATAVAFSPIDSNPRPTHHYKNIKSRLEESALDRVILKRTIAIFDLLAASEAKVHGVSIDDVHFHEIADWDSQADIVAAASIIEHLQADSWSCSTLPMGRGSVQTEHGRLPVPAPATTELLLGFTLHDDGESGERITPTGAAILAHLIAPANYASRPDGQLQSTGIGCGKKRFETVPNITRILAFEIAGTGKNTTNIHLENDHVGVITFEVDDMTPEELSTSIDYLRATNGVIDVSHHTQVGKKNRSQFSLQILCKSELQSHIVDACFLQTTTIGLRTSTTSRTILKRHHREITSHNKKYSVKESERPSGVSSAKIEADALISSSTLVERRSIAIKVEQLAATHDE